MMNRKGGVLMIVIISFVVVGIVIGYYLFSPKADVGDLRDIAGEIGDVAGGVENVNGNGGDEIEEIVIEEPGAEIAEKIGGSLPTWFNIELEDVNSGENFKISDFSGKPILLESFAVWCPKCTSQQNKIKELHKIVGEDVVSISLDTDPSEDATFVRQHTASKGFDWRYAISPIEMTEALKDEFGIGIVSAPSVPVILICGDQGYRQLGGGVKSIETLQDEIAAGC